MKISKKPIEKLHQSISPKQIANTLKPIYQMPIINPPEEESKTTSEPVQEKISKSNSLPDIYNKKRKLLLDSNLKPFVGFKDFKKYSLRKRQKSKNLVLSPVNIHTARMKNRTKYSVATLNKFLSFDFLTMESGETFVNSPKTPNKLTLKYVNLNF